MSSQKIEVGHILKSRNAVAFLLFKPSETDPGDQPLLFEQIFGRICPNNVCPTSIFDHLAHNFIAKELTQASFSMYNCQLSIANSSSRVKSVTI
jgi:hypothetical protein